MSGIAGIYHLDGQPVDLKLLKSMTDSIAHRGPDGEGHWVDGPVGFGHRMLWTTPESCHETLPFTHTASGFSIAADARLDNREDLFSMLNFNGRPKDTIGDSEIILAAYEKWGEESLRYLLGDFAFGIWDSRNHRFFFARDPIGIKPFYYYFDGKTFRWASEPKAIFKDGVIAKKPNFNLICLHLLGHFHGVEETLYENVYSLPPSHLMVLEKSSLHKTKYWDVNPSFEIRYRKDEEYVEHFLDLFKKAVQARLRSQSIVGVLTGGGLDSSSIVSVAQMLYRQENIQNHGFETFSILFDKHPCDERAYIADLAHKWNLKANYYIHELNESSLDFEESIKYTDVSYSPTLAFYAPILKDVKKRGIRNLLNGIGGDDLLAPAYTHLTDLISQGKFRRLKSQLKHDADISSVSVSYLFLKYCLRPFIPQSIKRVVKKAISPLRRNEIPLWLNSNGFKKDRTTRRNWKNEIFSVIFSTRSQQRIYDGLRYGWNRLAMDMVERFFGNFSVESRYPFFDQRLVEFALAIPEEQRWYNEWTKYVLRKAMTGILPESVRRRKDKAEFSSVYETEFKDRQYLKIERLISTSFLGGLGLIRTAELLNEFRKYREGKSPQNFGDSLGVFVWLELWCRSMADQPEGGNWDER